MATFPYMATFPLYMATFLIRPPSLYGTAPAETDTPYEWAWLLTPPPNSRSAAVHALPWSPIQSILPYLERAHIRKVPRTRQRPPRCSTTSYKEGAHIRKVPRTRQRPPRCSATSSAQRPSPPYYGNHPNMVTNLLWQGCSLPSDSRRSVPN